MEDMCVPCGDSFLNIRVGALIEKGGKLLMVQSNHGYLYSVGGRIKMGETAQEAVVREVFEETGVKMKVKRLVAVHENYFYGDHPSKQGKLIYEVSFYFQMEVPEDFQPVYDSITEAGDTEYLCWVDRDTQKKLYPEFFRKGAENLPNGVMYISTDERNVIPYCTDQIP